TLSDSTSRSETMTTAGRATCAPNPRLTPIASPRGMGGALGGTFLLSRTGGICCWNREIGGRSGSGDRSVSGDRSQVSESFLHSGVEATYLAAPPLRDVRGVGNTVYLLSLLKSDSPAAA